MISPRATGTDAPQAGSARTYPHQSLKQRNHLTSEDTMNNLVAPFAVPSPPPLLPNHIATGAPRNSAEIVTHRRFDLPQLRRDWCAACREELRFAFDPASQHAICRAASIKTGADADTFGRILEEITKRPDAVLMAYVAGAYEHRTKKPSRILGLLAQIAEAAK